MEITILISSAGRRGQLIECFRNSAADLGITIRIVAVDMRPNLSAACLLADRYYPLPACDSAEFIQELLAICEAEKVQLVVPTIDSELRILSENAQSFAAIGAYVAVSSPGVVALASDKQLTADVLGSVGVKTPRTLLSRQFIARPSALRWPVIIKPRNGSASVGVIRPKTQQEAAIIAGRSDDSVVQELWVGREYTVNLFFDRAGALRCVVPHWRIETRSGEVSKGRTERVSILSDAAKLVAHVLSGARGAMCFQAIVAESSDYVIFEINARFGGGYPLAHYAGAHFTRWLLEEAMGASCSAGDNWRAGVTMLRYDTAVFIDE